MTAVLARRPLGRRHAALGTGRFWIGVVLLLAIQTGFDLSTTVQTAAAYPDLTPVITAWAIVVVSDVAIVVVTRVLGEHLPNWLFWLWYAALAIAVALDLVATRDLENPGASMSVGISACLSLMLAVVTRSMSDVILAAAGLVILTAGSWALTAAYQPAVAHDAVFTLCQMILPVVVVAVIVDSWRRLMRRETEEVLSQAAIAAPRLTVGAEASEQLARLDLAAESLLGAVADGRIGLPLSEEIAKRAGTLATELRLHLLASRSKTWLALAIEESSLLRREVRIEDVAASAGLLSTRQRAALLSALWLLHDERGGAGATPISLAFGAPTAAIDASPLATIAIRVELPGSTRMTIDPGVWEHFARVGRYREALDGRGIRVDINCLVPRPRGTPRDRTDS